MTDLNPEENRSTERPGADPPKPLTLRQQLHEDWYANCGRASRPQMIYRALTRPGFQAVAVHRFGTWVLTAPASVRPALEALYRILFALVRNVYGVELPRDVKVGRRLIVGHQGGIVANPGAEIGDDCIIRHNVTLGAYVHSRPDEAPKLGARVQVGAGAAILGPITLGDDVAVGANAVVIEDVPPGHVAVAPGALIRPRREFRGRVDEVRKAQGDPPVGLGPV